MIVVRDVDRVGRRYDDVRDTMHDFMRRGVTVRTITAGHVFDASLTDPARMAARDTLIAITAATAHAWAATSVAAQREGIAKAKGEGKYKGRKLTARAKADDVRAKAATGMSMGKIAKDLGIGVASVHRILEGEAA